MARHKDFYWSLPDGKIQPDGSRTHEWPAIHAALLMDIRDELRALNRLLGCSSFLDLPRVLRQVRANTTAIKAALKEKK